MAGRSDACALLFNATYQCRLQFALANNFLLTLHLPAAVRTGTAFDTFYGQGMDVVPVLGQYGLSVYAPLAMLLVATLTLLLGGAHRSGRWRCCCRGGSGGGSGGGTRSERARRVAAGTKLLELKVKMHRSSTGMSPSRGLRSGGLSSWVPSRPLGISFGSKPPPKGLEMHSVKLLQADGEDPRTIL